MFVQVDPDLCSGSLLRFCRDLVAEIVADSLAEIKADAAGTLVFAAVKTRITVLKYSRKIRSIYSYSGILDAEYTGLICWAETNGSTWMLSQSVTSRS